MIFFIFLFHNFKIKLSCAIEQSKEKAFISLTLFSVSYSNLEFLISEFIM